MIIRLINMMEGTVSSLCKSAQTTLMYFGYSKCGFIRMNVDTGKIEQVFPEHNNNAWLLITSKYVVRFHKFDGLISVHDYSLNVVWAHNLYAISSFTDKYGDFHPGEIRNVYVYVYENKVIVFAGAFIYAFQLETGNLQWQLEETPFYRNMYIVGNIGYLTIGTVWAVLNLDNGTYSYKDMFPFITFNGKQSWITCGELTYHEGMLWLNVHTSGLSFIAAMHPETGKYEWVHHIQDADTLYPPKFHNNRMYLLDINNNLFVYEKE